MAARTSVTLCFINNTLGTVMKSRFEIKKLFTVAALAFSALSAHASAVLVFGDRSVEQSTLTSILTSQGHTVTNVSGIGLPANLSGFDTIWAVNIFSAFNSLAPSLQSFLNAGGGIHFTGERPCCETANGTIEAFLNANVIGGGIGVGGLGDTNGPYTFNATAVGGASTGLGAWVPSASGRMSGVTGRGLRFRRSRRRRRPDLGADGRELVHVGPQPRCCREYAADLPRKRRHPRRFGAGAGDLAAHGHGVGRAGTAPSQLSAVAPGALCPRCEGWPSACGRIGAWARSSVFSCR